MRVLQVNKFLKIVGGAETYMFTLSSLLQKNGIEVEYWGMADDHNIVEDSYNSFADNLDFKEAGSTLKTAQNVSSIIYSKKNQKNIAKVLDEFKPDIVHVHNYNFQLTTSILSEISKRGIKIIHTIHDSQIVCPNHRLYIEHKNEVCTRCLHGKFYNGLINKCFDNSIPKSIVGSVESYLTHNVLNVYNKYIDAFISPSNFFKDLIQPVIKKDIIVLPNCVESLDVSIESEKEDYVLFFGRLSVEKGLHRLYELFKDLPYKLVVIGKGDVIPTDYDNIEYLGPKYGAELFDYVSKAKFTIHPSYWYDNCPMSVVESYMLGTPIIVSNHSGLIEMINDQTGYAMDFYSENALEDLQTILSKNYKFKAKEISEYYTKNFGEVSHYQKIIKVYKTVLQN